MYTFSQMNRILHLYAVYYIHAREIQFLLYKIVFFFYFTYNNYVQLYYSIKINIQL